MADKKNASDATTAPKKGKKVLLLLVGLVLLGGLAAGGWIACTTFLKSDYPREHLEYVDLDDAVLRFAWEQIPEIYGHLVSTNTELALMEKEIDRIKGVGKQYPRQDRIVSSEIKRWDKNVQKLSGQLRRFQGQVEALYVTFKVNPDKGRATINEKSADLTSSMGEALAAVQRQTAPLKTARVPATGVKGLIEKIKGRFFS